MPSDVFRIDVKLLKDDLGDGSLHGITTTSVEALRVGQQLQGSAEELPSGFELAGGVGELRLDLGSFSFDEVELGLELRSWPVWVTQQIEQAVFARVQLVQPGTKTLLEVAHDALFNKKRVVQLTAYLLLEDVTETDGAKMCVHSGLNLGDTQVRQVADVLLPSPAEEVEVLATVSHATDDDHPMPTAVAPEQSLEPVIMAALTDASSTTKGQDALHAVVGLLGDEHGMTTLVLLFVVGDLADVVAVAEDRVELAQRQRLGWSPAGTSGTKTSMGDLV